MATYYVSGLYCTKSGSVGSFKYPRLKADSPTEAIAEASFKVQRRKNYKGKLDATATLNKDS